MIQPAMTALALILVMGQHYLPGAFKALQAQTVEAEPVRVVTATPKPQASSPAVTAAAPLITPKPEPVQAAAPKPLAQTAPQTAAPKPAPIVLAQVTPPPVSTPRPAVTTPKTETQAQPVVRTPIALTGTERDAALAKAKAALTAAKTAKGRFTQVNPDGGLVSGDFALRRPGKMRFDYAAPTPFLIVSDGTTVAMEDTELETVDRVPLVSTPLGLILDDNLDFGGDVIVSSVRKADGAVLVTVQDATGEVLGDLTMVFDAATYALRGWTAVDGELQATTVELLDVVTNGRIDPRLFRLNDRADEEDER